MNVERPGAKKPREMSRSCKWSQPPAHSTQGSRDNYKRTGGRGKRREVYQRKGPIPAGTQLSGGPGVSKQAPRQECVSGNEHDVRRVPRRRSEAIRDCRHTNEQRVRDKNTVKEK